MGEATSRWGPRSQLAPLRRRLLRAPARLPSDLKERLVALFLLVLVALLAGITLGHGADTLESLPGLLLMVPAAIALRGNIFGALGSRLGTAIHAGTFKLSARSSTVVGENLRASLVLTVATSVLLAVMAKGAAVAFGIADSISLADFITVSMLGGILASSVVLVTALGLTAGSVRFGWDPDNITAPLVTAVGDVATIPALVLAARWAGDDGYISQFTAVVGVGALPLMAVLVRRFGRSELKVIVRESMPVLMIGILLDLVAGVIVERQLGSFARYPVLLVLLPPFLAAAGALGGTLSSRLSSQLHLGMVTPARIPEVGARREMGTSLGLALPVFALAGALAHGLGTLGGLASPGLWWLAATSVIAGMVAAALAAIVAYYSTVGSVRVGLDPDTYGIPLVTSVLDLMGAFTLILAIESLGFL